MKAKTGRCFGLLRRLAAAAAGIAAAAGTAALPVFAEPGQYALPFQLNAPAAVSVSWQPTDDMPSACTVSYTKDSELTAYMKHDTDERLAIRQQYGYSELWIKGQLDWSIDSPNDWHYNQYWDTDGYDSEWKQHLGDWAYVNLAITSAKIDSDQIFRSFGNPEDASDVQWNGTETAPGWKSVLKDGQYELFTAPDGKKGAKIDLTKHQVYVRMRWLVVISRDDWEHDQYRCSGWSAAASVGTPAPKQSETQSAEETTVTTRELPAIGQLAAPAVSDLHLTGEFDRDGRAVAEFKLNVPEDISDDSERLKAAGGKLVLTAVAETDAAEESTLIAFDEIPLTAGERRVTFSLPECRSCRLCWYYMTEVINPRTNEPLRSPQSDPTEYQTLDVPVQTTETTGTTAPAKKKNTAARAMRRLGVVILLLAGLGWFTAFFMRKYHITIRKR